MRQISDKQRSDLLESFRKDLDCGSPASFRRAGEAAKVDARTARRAWLRGWLGQKPLKDLIESEKALARAALRREELAARLDEASRLAEEDAIASRVEAGKSVRLATAAARNSLVALHQAKVAEYQVKLGRLMQDKDPGSKLATAARKALSEIIGMVAKAVEAAERGQVLEARVLGEPTVVLGGSVAVRPVPPANVTTEEVVAEIEALTRGADELRALEAARDGADGNGAAAS